MELLTQRVLAHRGELDALRFVRQRLPPSEGMGMLAGRLQETPCNISIGNRSLRNRTAGGAGGRRGDIPAPPTRFCSAKIVLSIENTDRQWIQASLFFIQ